MYEIVKDQRTVLILGAGIHAAVMPTTADGQAVFAQLASWDAIQQGNYLAAIHGPTLAWELNALESIEIGQANERITKALKDLASRIRKLAANAKEAQWEPPVALQNLMLSGRVEHVISLNVDLLCEYWLAKKLNLNSIPRVQHGGAEAKGGNRSRNRKFVSSALPCQGRITFWYPHGDCDSANSLQFSLSDYAGSLKRLEDSRREFKAAEQHKHMQTPDITSWFDLFLTKQRLLFVGTSVDRGEWDLWAALLNRWRNFAQYRNQASYPETMVLTCKGQHTHLPLTYFKRIEHENFPAAWQLLETMVSNELI